MSIYQNYDLRQRVLPQVQDMERTIFTRNGIPFYGFHDFMRGTQQANREDYEEAQIINQQEQDAQEEQIAIEIEQAAEEQQYEDNTTDNIDLDEMFFEYKPTIDELFE